MELDVSDQTFWSRIHSECRGVEGCGESVAGMIWDDPMHGPLTLCGAGSVRLRMVQRETQPMRKPIVRYLTQFSSVISESQTPSSDSGRAVCPASCSLLCALGTAPVSPSAPCRKFIARRNFSERSLPVCQSTFADIPFRRRSSSPRKGDRNPCLQGTSFVGKLHSEDKRVWQRDNDSSEEMLHSLFLNPQEQGPW